MLAPALVAASPTCPLGYKYPDGKLGADSRALPSLVIASLMHERGPSPPSSSPVLGQSRVAPGCLPTYFCLVAYGSLAIYGFRV